MMVVDGRCDSIFSYNIRVLMECFVQLASSSAQAFTATIGSEVSVVVVDIIIIGSD